jgi:hypothetical protein
MCSACPYHGKHTAQQSAVLAACPSSCSNTFQAQHAAVLSKQKAGREEACWRVAAALCTQQKLQGPSAHRLLKGTIYNIHMRAPSLLRLPPQRQG